MINFIAQIILLPIFYLFLLFDSISIVDVFIILLFFIGVMLLKSKMLKRFNNKLNGSLIFEYIILVLHILYLCFQNIIDDFFKYSNNILYTLALIMIISYIIFFFIEPIKLLKKFKQQLKDTYPKSKKIIYYILIFILFFWFILFILVNYFLEKFSI